MYIHIFKAKIFNIEKQISFKFYYFQKSYQVLDIPPNSSQDVVKQAFLELAKKYHPDSNSPEADIDKFVEVENAFRTLSKHNTGTTHSEEVEKIVYDIRVI